jgi:hypothetical protein
MKRIEMGWTTGQSDNRSGFLAETEDFSLRHHTEAGCETDRASYWTYVYGQEDVGSPVPSAEI